MTETTAPRLTVHVPCHDYGRFLGDALDSLLAQTCTAWEAIVIDDASTDDTPQVVGRYDDPRFRFARHDVNRGHIATFNEAIGLARGEYFVILSADDRYHATFFERALACFDASPEVTLVYTDAEIIDEDGRTVAVGATTLDPDRDWVRDISVDLLFSPFIRGCSAVAPTRLLRELNGYDPELFHTTDTYLWRQLAFRGPVGHLTGGLYQQREHTHAMHTTTSWLELMTTEEPLQFARLFDDPALPARVSALRPRLEATLDVYRARREYHDHRYAAAAAAFLSAAGRDPKLWEADHPWWAFARDYARNHRRTG